MIALMRNQSCVFDIYVVVSRNGHCMVEIIQSFDQGSVICMASC
jgi:hypothetical protein